MRVRGMIMAALACALLAPAALQAQVEVRVVHRGLLGIFTESASADGVQRQVVLDVVPGSPADRAGIRKGDVVISINGAVATDPVMRATMAPGDSVVLRVLTDGAERTVSLVAAERPAGEQYMLPFRGSLPDSVMRHIAIIMDNVRSEVDSLVFLRNLRPARAGDENNVIIAFGRDSVRVRGLPGDSLSVFRFGEGFERFPEGARIHVFRGPAGLDSLRASALAAGGRLPFTHIDSMAALRPAEIFRSGMSIGMRAVAGAELSELNPDLAGYFGVADGVLVLNARDGTPAARAGMRAGDVIVQVDRTPVTSIGEVRRAIDAAAGATVEIRVLRRGQPVDVTIGRD
jgi:membrane-associated protease RseP (regulator of RpoE activity)